MTDDRGFWIAVVVIATLCSFVFVTLAAWVGVEGIHARHREIVACSRSVDPAGCLRNLETP